MKEQLKTAALTLLVAVSLVQSYLLIYRLPGTGSVVVSSAGYVRTDEMGEQLNVEDTLYPDRMIIHMGEDKHTIFYPNSAFYKLIYARIQARDFAAFQLQPTSGEDWEKIATDNPGIELSFGTGLPVPLLQKTMRLAADPTFETADINRIWIRGLLLRRRNVTLETCGGGDEASWGAGLALQRGHGVFVCC